MKYRRIIRLSGLSGIIAGACLLLLGMSFIVSVFVGEVALLTSSIFLTLGKLCELFLLFGIFSVQYPTGEKINLWGLILAVSGLTIDLFPPLGRVLFAIGILLFAISSRRSKHVPSWGF